MARFAVCVRLPGDHAVGRLLVMLTCAASLWLAGCSEQAASQQQGGGWPAPIVSVQAVSLEDVLHRRTYPARLAGARQVEVRSRTQGILEQRRYQEGQRVEQGDTLFLIDPAPARAALQRAQAQRDVAQAQLNQANREAKRVDALYARRAVSERERDAADSAVELARANLSVAQAVVKQAELDLEYTDVKAPLGGLTGLQAVPDGSLVQQGTLLTTIIEDNPLHIRFAIPEQDADLLRQHIQEQGGMDIQATLLSAEGRELGNSHLDYLASDVATTTGSVSARAVIRNENRRLIPGQFVRVRVPLVRFKQVALVPAEAITQAGHEPAVFIVNEQQQAELRPVRLGPSLEDQQVILSGVASGESIVVNGMMGLAPGATVTVKPAQGDAD